MPLHWQPVGPAPATTYWRRRGVLLLGILTVLVLLRPVFGGAASPAPTQTPTPTASPTAAPVRTAGPAPSPSAVGVAALPFCADGALTVSLTGVDPAPVGTAPRFQLVVRNTSAAACLRDLGPAAVELVVTSGTDRIWSSADCSPGGSKGTVTLLPGQANGQALIWPGTRSKPGCAGARSPAQVGTYKVVASVGAVKAPEFILRLRG